MARSFPADTKLQSFISEQYDRESVARMEFYKDKKQGTVRSAGSTRRRQQGGPLVNGLPAINPTEFGRQMLRQEKARLQQIALEAKRFQTAEEMRPPRAEVKETLYNGFTKEEKGRYQYLKQRKMTVPERKYHFPMLSSMVYGWKLEEEFQLQRPNHARTKMVQDTFYTRNTIPTLNDPPAGYRMENSKTFMI